MLEERLFESSMFGENAPFKILHMKKTLIVGMDHLIQLFYFFITNLSIYCAFKISNTTGNQTGKPQLKKQRYLYSSASLQMNRFPLQMMYLIFQAESN